MGVGTQLIQDALGRAEAAGEPAVMVEGIPAYYPRFGFERASALGFGSPHPRIPDEAFMVKRLPGDSPDIAGRIVYPAAFDVLGYSRPGLSRTTLSRHRLPFHLGRVHAGARGAVHLRPVVVRALRRLDVLRLADPRLQRRRLQRAPVRERELPGVRPSLFIAFRFAVASSSVWPPERNTIPGTAAGTCWYRKSIVAAATSSTPAPSGVVAREHHVRLQQRAAKSTRWSRSSVKTACSTRPVAARSLDRVRAVHQHLGLDDRDDAGLLAERRVPRERVRVRPDAVLARHVGADRVRRAPLREARAELAVLLEPPAQAVETLGDRLASASASGFAPWSTLIPGMMPFDSSSFGNGVPSAPTGGSSRRRG